HGVEDAEKEKGQRFEIDVELFLDLRKPGQSDRLEETVDYSRIYQVIEELVIEGEYNLIEALAEDVARAILNQFAVPEITVRVRKPHAPLRGISEGVEVEITRP
ncbi:MAG: dihydroneopterin aldolase, partial [bacterium]